MTSKSIPLALLLVAASALAEPVPRPSITQGIDVAPELASAAAAKNCKALRSATYRVVTPTFGGTASDQTGRMVIDAARLAVVRPDGSRGTWKAQSACRFADADDNGTQIDIVVSQGGILGGRISVSGGGSYRMLFGFPEQNHALTELAGTWSLVGLHRGADEFYGDTGSITFDHAGKVTATSECANYSPWSTTNCSQVPANAIAALEPFVIDAGGGFVSRSGARTTRLFLFSAANGLPTLVRIDSDGAVAVGSPAGPFVIPPLGQTAVRWNLDVTSRLASATSTYMGITVITDLDLNRKSYVRTKRTIGLSDEHLETLLLDNPRPGYITRLRGEAPDGNGRPVGFTEVTSLQFLGAGFSASVVPGIKLFEISIFAP